VRTARRTFAEVHADRDVERFGQGEVRFVHLFVQRMAAVLRADLGEDRELMRFVELPELGGRHEPVAGERDRRDHAFAACPAPLGDACQ
jgi:hypothetical protein